MSFLPEFLTSYDEKDTLAWIKNRGATVIVSDEDREFFEEWLGANRVRTVEDIRSIGPKGLRRPLVVMPPFEEGRTKEARKSLVAWGGEPARLLRWAGDVFTGKACGVSPVTKHDNEAGYIDILSDEVCVVAVTALPRSGSTYVAELLATAKGWNQPKEHIRPDVAELVVRGWLDMRAYLTALANEVGIGGVFYTKLIDGFVLRSRPSWTAEEDKFVRALLQKAFVVRLVREDKVAQAVSAEKARKTQVFHVRAKGDGRRTSSENVVKDLERAEDEVVKKVAQYRKKEQVWGEFLDEYAGGASYRAIYEEFRDNQARALRQLVDATPGDTAWAPEEVQSDLEPVSDRRVREFVERVRRRTEGRGSGPCSG